MKRSLLLLVAAATAHSPVAPMLRRLALLKQRRPHALANVGFGCCLTAATIKDELALRCTLLTATVFFLSNNLASALSTSGTVNWPGAA